jgi:membrane protease YdiL (CAAX protease family)
MELTQQIMGHSRLAARIDSNISSGSLGAWMVAETVFAGIVEERLYRGYAITRLRQHMGIGWAMLVFSLFFGPLHWGEGCGTVMAAMVSGVLLGSLFF